MKSWTSFDGSIHYNPVIEDMIGKRFDSVYQANDELIFDGPDGKFTFYHAQNCCESVYIESIVGDLEDLQDTLLIAEVSSQEDLDASESGTWTFYKFATKKGYVDVRWHGTSNGYYSESVDLCFEPAAV